MFDQIKESSTSCKSSISNSHVKKTNVLVRKGFHYLPCKPLTAPQAPICHILNLGVTSQKIFSRLRAGLHREDNKFSYIKNFYQNINAQFFLSTDTFADNGWIFNGDIWKKIWDRFGQRIRGVGYICTRSTLDVTCDVHMNYDEARSNKKKKNRRNSGGEREETEEQRCKKRLAWIGRSAIFSTSSVNF